MPGCHVGSRTAFSSSCWHGKHFSWATSAPSAAGLITTLEAEAESCTCKQQSYGKWIFFKYTLFSIKPEMPWSVAGKKNRVNWKQNLSSHVTFNYRFSIPLTRYLPIPYTTCGSSHMDSQHFEAMTGEHRCKASLGYRLSSKLSWVAEPDCISKYQGLRMWLW